jgi:hypothetical protein
MKSLSDVITSVLDDFNSRQSYFGFKKLSSRELGGLRAMLELRIQENLREVFESVVHDEQPASPAELDKLYNIIKVLVTNANGKLHIKIDELYWATQNYLIIEDDGITTTLTVTDQEPQQ